MLGCVSRPRPVGILDDSVGSLDPLDLALDQWRHQPGIGPALGTEVGLYLGTVLVGSVDGARWHVWPNGHPVVLLDSGREFDVTALVSDRLDRNGTSLPGLYAEAMAGT